MIVSFLVLYCGHPVDDPHLYSSLFRISASPLLISIRLCLHALIFIQKSCDIVSIRCSYINKSPILSFCQTFEDLIARDEDARSSEDYSIAEIVVDVLPDFIILRARLQPQGRDPKGLSLLKDAKSHLENEIVSAIHP